MSVGGIAVPGNATAAEVEDGVTFSSGLAGMGATGTMPLLGDVTLEPGDSAGPGYVSSVAALSPTGGSVVFDTPGDISWTPGEGVTRALAVLRAGGGGGGSFGDGVQAGGGGGGGLVAQWIECTPGVAITGHVGAGGVGGAGVVSGNGNDGANGENTWLNAAANTYAGGGLGGLGGSSSGTVPGGAGVNGIGAGVFAAQTQGYPGQDEQGGGGAGPGGDANGFNGGPASGTLPAGGNGSFGAGTPAAASAPSGGGGGSEAGGQPGGDGAPGSITIIW